MSYRDYIKLGLNHHLLYAEVASNPADHERTLQHLLADSRLEVLDLWIADPQPFRQREIDAILAGGKEIYYNVGSRKGKPSAQPCTLDPQKREYSLAFYKDELDRALAVRATKVITNSGGDIPDHRPEAFEALVSFYAECCRYVADKGQPNMVMLVEPTDRDLSKKKFIGSSIEAAQLCRRVHELGYANMASMVDMCHVPLMHETLSQAMADTGDQLGHIHMGNCILKDTAHPMFGDKHIGWGVEGSEYGVKDIAELLTLGIRSGYFKKSARGSASFEMRPLPGLTPEASLDKYFELFEQAWSSVSAALKLEN